jgi:hypothetical protein
MGFDVFFYSKGVFYHRSKSINRTEPYCKDMDHDDYWHLGSPLTIVMKL